MDRTEMSIAEVSRYGIILNCSRCNTQVVLPPVKTPDGFNGPRVSIENMDGWEAPPLLCPSCVSSPEEQEVMMDEEEIDKLYLWLKGSREKLCLAQMVVPRHWTSNLQTALNQIDEVGSALCPKQWSRFDLR